MRDDLVIADDCLLAVSKHARLAEHLGTYCGDNGTSTSALPDIRRRITVGCPSEAHPKAFGTEQVPIGGVDLSAHAHTTLAPVLAPEFRTPEMRQHRVVEAWLREDQGWYEDPPS